MNLIKTAVIASLASALAACQGVPGATRLAPPADQAMDSPVAEIEATVADTTSVDRATQCDIHVYRAAGGHARAESLCGEERTAATGHWSILGGGAYCVAWNEHDWQSGCYAWQHTGGGSYTWQKIAGSATQETGTNQVYAGNPFNL